MSAPVGPSVASAFPPDMLSKACKTKQLDSVNAAILCGALPDSHTLTLACFSRNIAIVRAVIAKNAWADEKTMDTALETADPLIISAVAPLCAKVNAVAAPVIASDKLSVACQTKNVDIVKEAILSGAKPDSLTLFHGCASGNIAILRAVITVGAKASDMDSEGQKNTLNWALSSQNLEFVQVAFNAGLRPSPGTLTYALPGGSKEIIDLIASFGGRADDKSLDAVIPNKLHLVDWLIGLGATPSEATLTKACSIQNDDKDRIIQTILRLGGKPDRDTLHTYLQNLAIVGIYCVQRKINIPNTYDTVRPPLAGLCKPNKDTYLALAKAGLHFSGSRNVEPSLVLEKSRYVPSDEQEGWAAFLIDIGFQPTLADIKEHLEGPRIAYNNRGDQLHGFMQQRLPTDAECLASATCAVRVRMIDLCIKFLKQGYQAKYGGPIETKPVPIAPPLTLPGNGKPEFLRDPIRTQVHMKQRRRRKGMS